MLKHFHIPLSYINYWLQAVDKHSLHPPFIFQLYCSVIKSTKHYYCFDQLIELRNKLYNDTTLITIKDLGSGSRSSRKGQRKVCDIARTGLSSTKFSQLLFRLALHFTPKTIIELGTSLGVNSLYLASYSEHAQIYTFEGCPDTAAYARKLFHDRGKKNINLIEGDITEKLPELVNKLDHLDFIYFDANHSYGPTISYFETCLLKAHEKSVFIFDDIHWSADMENAWKAIKSHPKVTMTIDIFDAGLVFFDTTLHSENYILEF